MVAVESAIKVEVLAEMFKKYNLIAITQTARTKRLNSFLKTVNTKNQESMIL